MRVLHMELDLSEGNGQKDDGSESKCGLEHMEGIMRFH